MQSVVHFVLALQEITIQVNAVHRIVAIGDDIWLNGDPVSVSIGKGFRGTGGHRLEKRGNYYYLEYGTLNVKWDNAGTWFITLREPHGTHKVKGLCGDFNDIPTG